MQGDRRSACGCKLSTWNVWIKTLQCIAIRAEHVAGAYRHHARSMACFKTRGTGRSSQSPKCREEGKRHAEGTGWGKHNRCELRHLAGILRHSRHVHCCSMLLNSMSPSGAPGLAILLYFAILVFPRAAVRGLILRTSPKQGLALPRDTSLHRPQQTLDLHALRVEPISQQMLTLKAPGTI